MCWFKNFAFALLLLLHPVFADSKDYMQYYSFLKNGLNINEYKACRDLMHKCPTPPHSLFPEEHCVMQVLHNNKTCNQFEKLVDVLDFTPNLLLAKQVKNFTIIDMAFTGDGQDNYYIISKGYLINTQIDPKKIDARFAKKYKNTSFGIFNWGEPQYRETPDGVQIFTVVLQMTDSCLACAVIGWAIVDFNFSQEGTFINAKLVNFIKGSKPPTLNFNPIQKEHSEFF